MKTRTALYEILSTIPLDIAGSNLSETGWCPSVSDAEFMSQEGYEQAKNLFKQQNSKVLFTNVRLLWDSCDCMDNICSHGSYVYEIHIISEDKPHKIELEEDTIYFSNDGVASMPILNATVWDFYRLCEMVDIKLKFSDYLKSLLSTEF